jgi:hypothetical protein
VRRLVVVLAAVSLVLAGCGGGGGGSSKPAAAPLTKSAYQAKLAQIAKDIGARLKATTSAAKTPTKKDLDAAKKAILGFADELEQVSPPAEVAKAHQDLITGMRRLGNDLQGIFKKADEAAKAKDPSAALAAVFGAPAIQLLLKAQQEFKAKGYNLNLNG